MYSYGVPPMPNYEAMIQQLQQMQQNQQQMYNQLQQRQAQFHQNINQPINQQQPPQPPAPSPGAPAEPETPQKPAGPPGVRTVIADTLEQAKKLAVGEDETVIGIVKDGSAIHVKKHSTETWTMEEETFCPPPKPEPVSEPEPPPPVPVPAVDTQTLEALRAEVGEIRTMLQEVLSNKNKHKNKGGSDDAKNSAHVLWGGPDDTERPQMPRSKGRQNPPGDKAANTANSANSARPEED